MQNNLISVLNRTFAQEFYRLNSGFFLFFGTLAFGFMSAIEHKALAQFFVSSLTSVTIPVGVWLLYGVKVLHFNMDQLKLPANRFVFNIQFLTLREQLLVTTAFIVVQFLPAIVYGVFLVLMALQISAYPCITVIAVAQTVLVACITVVVVRTLRNPFIETKTTRIKRFIDRYYVRHIIHFYTEWLLRKEPLMLAGTKALTGVLIWGSSKLYLGESYDWRLMAMTITVVGIANVPLLFHLTMFEHSHMSWLKNMPVRMTTRYIRLLAAAAIFGVVELALLIRSFGGHFHFGWTIQYIFYLMSLLALYIGYLHIKPAHMESAVKRTFWIFVLLILMILFKVPLIAIIITNFVCGYLLFSRKYYLFEPLHE